MSKFVLTAQLRLQAPTNVRQVVNQIQSQLNSVSVNVDVQGAPQAAKQLKEIEKETKAATSAAQQLGKTFGVSLKRFAAFSIATRAVGLFTSRLSDAVDESIDFQRELIKISQVTGKTVDQLRGVTNEIDRLSTTLGTSSKSLLSVTRILAQAGIQSNDLRVALGALAKTTLAPTFDDITQTAEGAIAVISQFGEGVGALERQLGAINAVAGQFAVESGDLISVVRRTGGVFKSAGGSLEELLALFTSVRATTRESAESIATGLRTVFTRIQRPATIQYLKEFGVELTDLNGKFVGPYEAVRQLSTALQGLEEGDIRFVQIAEQLGGFRQIGKVIPLLQQFNTAEAARQAAIEGGNSLTKDAATAQQALAVQITKVKEEFLAFIRSISNTSTFQLFVKTSLDLASALIDIGEAIKPLIPLLGAFAGIKIARGVGGFLSGIGATLGKNAGGKIHAFATGGLVPGVGNRDTVPAMLSPGEFVIRKSSVNKIGASNLAAMNNGYAAGGVVTDNRHGYGFFTSNSRTMKAAKKAFEYENPGQWRKLNDDQKQEIAVTYANQNNIPIPSATESVEALNKPKEKSASKLATRYPGGVYTTIPGAIGGFFLNPAQGKDGISESGAKREFTIKGQKAVLKKGTGINTYTAGGNELKTNSTLIKAINKSSAQALQAGIEVAVPQFEEILSIPPIKGNMKRFEEAATRLSKNDNAIDTTSGFLFEGIIDAITGAKLAGGPANFDFPKSAINAGRGRLGLLFGGNLDSLVKADAKKSRKQAPDIFKKIVNDIAAGKTGEDEGVIREFARGGRPMGTDTVPAMLTPGEYVINRQAAESIGYGNLNRMNKHGVSGFAKGGPVQYFQTGTGATGVTSVSGEGSFAKFITFQSIAGLATTKLSELSKTVEGTDTGMSRVVDSLGSMINIIGSTIFTLQSFGVAVEASSIKKLFGTGQGSIGDLVSKGASRLFSKKDNFISKNIGTRSFFGAGFNAKGNVATEGLNRRQALSFKAGRVLSKNIPLGGVTKLFGTLARFAGPVGAGLGIFTAFSSVLKAGLGIQSQYNQAIKDGNAAEAQKLAVSKNLNGVFQLLPDNVQESIQGFKTFFGAESVVTLKNRAKADAFAAKSVKELSENSRAAADTLKDLAEGRISAVEAIQGGIVTSGIESSIKSFRSNVAANADILSNQRSTGAFAVFRNAATLLGAESASSKNLRLADEVEKSNLDSNKNLESLLPKVQPVVNDLIKSLAISSGGNSTYEDFIKKLSGIKDAEGNAVGKTIVKLLRLTGSIESTKKSIDNYNVATRENLAYIKALNFGLREVNARASASTIALQNLIDSTTSGASSYDKTIRIIEASLSSVATALDPTDVKNAQDQVAQTLRDFGASDSEVAKIRSTLTGFNTAQKVAISALESLKKGLAGKGNTNTSAVVDDFKKELLSELDKAQLGDGTRRQVLDILSKLNLSDTDIANIQDGADLSSVLSKILDPQSKKIAEKALTSIRQAQEQEKILTNLVKQRISLEREAVQARQKAIDIELEAAKNIQEFGGRILTFADKVNFANRNVNESLNNAGLSGVGGGTPREIAAVQETLLNRSAALTSRVNRGAATGINEFSGTDVEKDQRQNLKAAQDELIRFARQRIQLIKDELDIIRKKNALEKSSLESLLSGDITSFFDKQAAVGASSVLRGGGDVSSFSASTLGRAFNDLKDQDIPPRELQRIASSVLGVFGVQDTRSARVLSNNTTQEQRLQREGRELSSVLSQGGRNLANIAEMTVTTNNVIIKYAGSQVPGSNIANNIANQTQSQIASSPQAISTETVNKIDNVFTKFTETVTKLENTNLSVKLDPFNINVNFNGAGFLSALNDTIKTEVIKTVQEQLGKLGFDESGKPKRSSFITGN